MDTIYEVVDYLLNYTKNDPNIEDEYIYIHDASGWHALSEQKVSELAKGWHNNTVSVLDRRNMLLKLTHFTKGVIEGEMLDYHSYVSPIFLINCIEVIANSDAHIFILDEWTNLIEVSPS